jgi:hypothetical protein
MAKPPKMMDYFPWDGVAGIGTGDRNNYLRSKSSIAASKCFYYEKTWFDRNDDC